MRPAPPQRSAGVKTSDRPGKTANLSCGKEDDRRESLPMFPQDNFVPTMLGCSARVAIVSESRSSPDVTTGKL